MRSRLLILLITTFIVSLTIIVSRRSPSHAQGYTNWYTAGANSQRTSWIPETIPGSNKMSVEWSLPITPYISSKAQVIAVDGVLFISTSKGILAINANHTKKWEFASGYVPQSVTVANGKVYFGSMDRKLYALNQNTGALECSYLAPAGFSTNPLYVDNGSTKRIYAGNRDGKMYIFNANCSGSTLPLITTIQTGGYIDYSAAWGGANEDTVYFASNDSRAYAISNNVTTPTTKWVSNTLPGQGFYSWWPVPGPNGSIVFTSTLGYKGKAMAEIRDEIFINTSDEGYTAGDIIIQNGRPYLDTTTVNPNGNFKSISDYFEDNPSHRTFLVLNRTSGSWGQAGQERTYNFDGDSKQEYAPFIWGGMTGTINRHPPALSPDQKFYIRTGHFSDGAIPGGGIVSWQEGSKLLELVNSKDGKGWGDWPIDEPGNVTGAGSVIYHVHCCERIYGGVDNGIPNDAVNATTNQILERDKTDGGTRQWRYHDSFWNIPEKGNIWFNNEGYDFYQPILIAPPSVQGMTYTAHADVQPLIPHQGKLYGIAGNALVALSPNAVATKLSPMNINSSPQVTPVTSTTILGRLNSEIQKLVSLGANDHLQAGYYSAGWMDTHLDLRINPGHFNVFNTPGENLYILLRAYNHVQGPLKTQLKNFIFREYGANPSGTPDEGNGYNNPLKVATLGYNDGHLSRLSFNKPYSKNNLPTRKTGFDIFGIYAAYKFAQTFPDDTIASSILTNIGSKLPDTVPTDIKDTFHIRPDLHNKYIAAYIGYLGLQELAGQPLNTDKQGTLNQLIADRVNNFTWYLDTNQSSYGTQDKHMYYHNIVGWNFMWLVPEMMDKMSGTQKNAFKPKVLEAFNKYNEKYPYWHVGKSPESFGEGTLTSPYSTLMLSAKAWVLEEPFVEIQKYVDTNTFNLGDMYHINNLTLALEASDAPPPSIPPTEPPTPTLPAQSPTPTPPTLASDLDGDGDVDIIDFGMMLLGFGENGFNIFSLSRLIGEFGSSQ